MAQLKYKLNGEWVPLNLGGAGSGEQYELPVATQDTLGGVSIGEGIDITPEGKISVKTPSSPAESVLYTAQELTEEQKAQARQNIGAQNLYNGLTPVNYSCTDGTYSVSDTVYLESGNIISPVDTVSNDVRIAFRYINLWNIPTQLDYWKDDIKKYKLLIDNGYLENNTIWYSKPDKKLKKQIRFGTNSTLGNYIIFNFNYDYEVIGQLVYYVDTDTISTGTDTYLNHKLNRDKNNVLSYSAIKLSSDPTEPMQIATKQYVDNAPIKKASATELGGIKVGTGLAIADDGTLSSNGAERIKYNFHSATITDEDKVVLKEIIKNPVGDFTFDGFQVIDIYKTETVIMFGVMQARYNRVDYYGIVYSGNDITGNKWQLLKHLYLSENQITGEILTADNFNNYFDQNFGWRIASSSEVYNAKELCLFYQRTDGGNAFGTAYYNFRTDDGIHDGNLSDHIYDKFILFYSPNSQSNVFWQYNGNDFELSTSDVSIERILYKS